MCRWMAWHGQALLIEELLFKTKHGLVDQSLHARMGAETTNGDGFGVGWYGVGEGPAVYRSISPAWADANLRQLAAHVEAPLFLAHVRATSGTAVQETNCHPFVHADWLFVHNGLINEFHAVRRELMLALDAGSFAAIEGSADSEVIFRLALGFGLESEPISGRAPRRPARAGRRGGRPVGGRSARPAPARPGERKRPLNGGPFPRKREKFGGGARGALGGPRSLGILSQRNTLLTSIHKF